ncbi:helix-hairpin-helix domain-containing protein [Actinacidiphila glaucinigra]|uniref:ATP-dependent exoDNAse (Exonuclease V), alpha subunit, helicase superfamily I n=1 Tax=Actinacidiphila glaucinigra TaxID=235986 RepID=A0A239JVG5_9ACTN|nr:helix-hairpin-helix domain-containing protein [Actinacidiphila glaucinigra]SNT09448.1 ATP-dependent exoDNAse (exonuclease V), alpha subunit, helicase superfamily I [Actinacidiphila glaucinigra]
MTEDREDRDREDRAEPEETAGEETAAPRRPRPSTEGVGSQLPAELTDLAAAVRAIERGERPAAPVKRGGPARPAAAPSPAPAPAPVARPSLPAQLSGDAVAAARTVLAAGGAPESLAEAAVEALGERAGDALREDPWQILALAGIRVEQADGFAKTLLGGEGGPGDERRVRALVVWLLERAAERGHTALEWGTLGAALGQNGVADAEETLKAAVADGLVLVFHVPDESAGARTAADDEDEEAPVRLLLGLDRFALAEESLADGLSRLLNTFDADGSQDWEGAAGAAPSPSAAALVRAAAGSGLVAHTGAEAAREEPAALVAAARSLGLRAWAVAATEDGRRRLAGAVDADATATLAGLLSGHEGPGRDEDGALALDLLAVLDAPQLDVETAATLVESVPDGARLVLSGDPAVLWSPGPGRVFADLLAAKVCPQVASRTPDPGPVGELVSGIGFGELAEVDAPGKEVVIVPVRDAGEAVHRTVQLVADSVPRVIGVPPEHTQVITPGHGGAAGTRALNAALKERLNRGPGRFGGFDPGDRIMYAPAAGTAVPGTVVSADAQGLRLDCGGTPVVVAPDAVAAEVRHGWAVTAHQAAGRRWPAAVVVLPGDSAQALTRAWVYTAFSRGERHLSVVQGIEQALPRVVAEVPARDRTTRLRDILREQAAAAAAE